MFAAIGIIRFAPREQPAYAAVTTFTFGVCIATVLVAVVEFAVLPGTETFAGLSIVIDVVVLSLGALAAQSWQGPTFGEPHLATRGGVRPRLLAGVRGFLKVDVVAVQEPQNRARRKRHAMLAVQHIGRVDQRDVHLCHDSAVDLVVKRLDAM
jgi:hypothetical protein